MRIGTPITLPAYRIEIIFPAEFGYRYSDDNTLLL